MAPEFKITTAPNLPGSCYLETTGCTLTGREFPKWIVPPMCSSDFAHLCKTNNNFRSVLPKAAILALLCASLTTFASTAFAQQGTFVLTGNLNTGRYEHTATLLNNGTVLIAGGATAVGNGTTLYLASAEL